MQQQFLFKQGWITIKKGLLNSKKFITLCAPANIQDVQKVFEVCFQDDPYSPIKNKAIPWLGNITRSASKGTPLIMISNQEKSESPIFIHLDQSMHIIEETETGKACTFELLVANQSITFACFTSVDYQDWIQVLRLATDLAHLSHQSFQSEMVQPWVAQLDAQ